MCAGHCTARVPRHHVPGVVAHVHARVPVGAAEPRDANQVRQATGAVAAGAAPRGGLLVRRCHPASERTGRPSQAMSWMPRRLKQLSPSSRSAPYRIVSPVRPRRPRAASWASSPSTRRTCRGCCLASQCCWATTLRRTCWALSSATRISSSRTCSPRWLRRGGGGGASCCIRRGSCECATRVHVRTDCGRRGDAREALAPRSGASSPAPV